MTFSSYDESDTENMLQILEEYGPVVVGFTGYMQSGKTTAAKHLVSKYGFKRIAMAKELKLEVAKLLAWFDFSRDNDGEIENVMIGPINTSVIEIVSKNKSDYDARVSEYLTMFDDSVMKRKYRLMLQWWGTEYRRNSDANYWINKWIDSIGESRGRFVIDDVRFDNEIEMVRDYFNGTIIRIVRPGQEVEGQIGSGHSSEHPDTLVSDGTVYNYENKIEDTYRDVESVLTECMCRRFFDRSNEVQ